MLAMASCSNDEDIPVVPETSQAADDSEVSYAPISWLARAYTPEDIKQVEDDINAIRGAGYTYRDNQSHCVGTDMEVFNMRKLRDMEKKYNTSYIVDDYNPANEQKFFYSESVKELNKNLSMDIGIGSDAGVLAMG